jgi:hypothetical protein
MGETEGGRGELRFQARSKYVHKDDRGTGQDPKPREDVDDPPHKVHDDFHPSDCLLLAGLSSSGVPVVLCCGWEGEDQSEKAASARGRRNLGWTSWLERWRDLAVLVARVLCCDCLYVVVGGRGGVSISVDSSSC